MPTPDAAGTVRGRMVLSILGVLAGLALLTYAADQFVIGAARVAAHLRLSAVLIGAVVIGFGTSAPELVVSGIAAARGSLDIGVGNIIGSNVANLTLVLGTAALVTPIVVSSPTLRREVPISVASVLVFGWLVQGGLTRLEAGLLALLLVVALAVILSAARREPDPQMSAEVEEYLADEAVPVGRESLRTLLGLAGTLLSAHILVSSATAIAHEAGLAEGFVGLTIVAIGTSLPEFATGLQAARKHETDLIVGNLLGSNLFNSFAVGATAGLIGPGPLVHPTLTGLAVGLMVVVSVLAGVFMLTGRRVLRWEGVVLLGGYVAVVPFLA